MTRPDRALRSCEEDCLHGGSKLPRLSGTKHEPPSPAHAPRNSRDDGRVGILGRDRSKLFSRIEARLAELSVR